jgi:NNP family nitrate/nitrite transporter-like MFS transporter
VKDIKGRVFKLPVNDEHKATECGPKTACMCAEPHMHEFWAATIGFFCTFFSCFAPGALGVYYKHSQSNLDLGENPKLVLGDAGTMAVSGTIAMRVLAGPMCDVWGARKTFAFLLLIGIPGMLIFALAQEQYAFKFGRLLIGLSLATFVTCQVWCTQFFAKNIVGTVNATAGGWGNLGGGITLLLMPQIMDVILSMTGDNIDLSWRLSMIVPVVMHLISVVLIITARDLPDGSYKELEAAGIKQKSKGAGNVAILGFTNTNALIMTITYGLCFGVELCMNNKLVPYFTRYYGMHPRVAGPLGACFSLMNLFARSWGGLLSDWSNKKFGMRGRITAMWVVQTIEGVFCILMGLVTIGMTNPDTATGPAAQAEYVVDGTQYIINGTLGSVGMCASALITAPTTALVAGVETAFPPAGTLIYIGDPNPVCVRNGGTLGLTMLMMIFFSICVQMAEGLHFGIVPYISRPALGVVSGMVGAGGNAGAMYSSKGIVGVTHLDAGFMELGVTIIIGSLTMLGIFFPGEGGVFLPKTLNYNPQLVKEAAGQKGSDELDFGAKGTEAHA